jgi:hypothetical protein
VNRQHTKRVHEIPARRGVWLFTYDDVKYNTKVNWIGYVAGGVVAAALGSVMLWTVVVRWPMMSASAAGFWIVLVLAAFGYSFMFLPAGVIYFMRRRRHEAVGVWECETPGDESVHNVERHDNGSDDH